MERKAFELYAMRLLGFFSCEPRQAGNPLAFADASFELQSHACVIVSLQDVPDELYSIKALLPLLSIPSSDAFGQRKPATSAQLRL